MRTLLAAGGALSPVTVRAQETVPRAPAADSIIVPLSLAEARDLAARGNPEFLVARHRPAVARGELQQASAFRFNPDLSVLGRTQPEIMLTQEIEWAGQRDARVRAARNDLTRTRFAAVNTGRLVLTDVSLAFYRSLAARRRREVVSQVSALSERLLAAVRVQLAEGEVSTLDANLAELEHGRIRARASAARRELLTVELELKRLLGLPPGVALRLDDSTAASELPLSTDSLVSAALRARPDVREAAADLQGARARLALARREAWPNIRVGMVAEPGRNDGNRFGVAGGISLPLLNRNRGAINARTADVRVAELRGTATEALVRAEVASALERLRASSDELRQYEESVLVPARNNAGLLGEAYRAGKIPLPTLLLLRNQLLDAEIGYWDAWLARNESAVALESATGTLTPVAPGEPSLTEPTS